MAQVAFSKEVGDSVSKVGDEVAVGEDLAFQEKWWRFERVVWTGFAFILVLALAGAFGRGPLAYAKRRTTDGAMDVRYATGRSASSRRNELAPFVKVAALGHPRLNTIASQPVIMKDPMSQREGTRASRRDFLRAASGMVVAAAASTAIAQESVTGKPNQADDVQLSQIHTKTEQPEKVPGPLEADYQRTGYAIVGLGRLALGQILPAMGKSQYSKPVVLVSGDRQKAMKIAAQYGIKPNAIYNYETYDRIAENPEIKAIYIVLPNSMHAEFVVRGAKAGKHILCEKPMATSVKDCERMIAVCKALNVKLMIAYRSQYETYDRAMVKMIREGQFGTLKQFIATNSQNQGDPAQWRLKKALSGGGCMPDVGIYCLNAARFLSGEEPYEVQASVTQPKDDPRFAEVEASCQVIAKFPSGFTATFNSAYNAHKSQFLRIEGTEAFAELNPAFAYSGIKMKFTKFDKAVGGGMEIGHEPSLEVKDQFAAEMDHFSLCIQRGLPPHTPGEEGLQDQQITDAIYESARTGKAVKLAAPQGATRGPEPENS